ncbi:hypothetical protein [Defluviimonas sp. SAOS-178_SWC]|uniref:hypothetical protein n=1 Tax=Defluviimonas sp. SAOS-178_SWC TaxID=3121287 RepID=UPI0032213A48
MAYFVVMIKVHIHEDDVGIRNLYPASALREISDDLSVVQASFEKNRSPDGLGWSEIHIVQEPENSFLSLNPKLADIVSVIELELPRIDEFEVGFGSDNPLHHFERDALCYGFGRHLYLKLDADGDDLRAIWYEARSRDPEELLALRRAIEAVDGVQPLMLADYWLNLGGLVRDSEFLDRYFGVISEAAAKREAAIQPSGPEQYAPAHKIGGWFAGLIKSVLGRVS